MERLFSHALVLEDGRVTSSELPDGVSFDNQTLTFTRGAQVHVILTSTADTQIAYDIKDSLKVDIIETRDVKDASLTRNITVGESANVSVFTENTATGGTMHFDETGQVAAYGTLNLGLSELSEGDVDFMCRYDMKGEEAAVKLRMAALSKDNEKKHYNITLKHMAKNTTGIMDNYGVAKDSGSLVIDGIGSIDKGMHGSEAHQTNKIMVFDDRCHASANPYLYIDDYDVKASHAAGVGKMDENHLYYLQSRGLTERQAMQLITYGYLRPVVDVVDNDLLKQRFEASLGKVGA